ncbi:hypothetical protein K2X33_13150 [bacterium]|nr:hypothetical protein [bacterium]
MMLWIIALLFSLVGCASYEARPVGPLDNAPTPRGSAINQNCPGNMIRDYSGNCRSVDGK